MDELQRSPEIETEIIREAVLRMRAKDQWCQKKYPFGERLTFWNADETRHFLYRTAIRMRTGFGEEILFTGNPKLKDKDTMVIHVNAVVPFQFLKIDSLKVLFQFYKVLKEDGCIDVGDFSMPEFQNILKYCRYMDAVIIAEADKVRGLGVIKDIFQKFWSDMGGDLISKTDRLGNRMRFYRDLIKKFKENKELWKGEMIRMKLIVS